MAMRCRVSGSALEQAARFLAAATFGARTTLPILSYILLDAQEGDTLRMASTNLTLWLEWTVVAEVEESGQIAVAGKEWRSLVTGLTSPSVELEAPSELEMAGRMDVRFDGGEYKLPVLPAEEFPLPPEEVSMREPIQITGRKLAEALRKVMFAASPDPTMGIFTGVHFRKEEGDEWLDIVATDTHRLALFRLEDENFPIMNLTLPASALKVLIPLVERAAAIIWRISEDNTLVEFTGEQWRVLITGLAGTYANYRKVIPQQFLHQIKIRVDEILPPLRRMTVFRPSGRKQPLRVIMRLVPDTSSMELVAIDIELGSYEEVGKETVKVEWLSGSPEPYTIAFQHPYLMEFLSTVKTGEVTINFQEPTQAVLFKPSNDDNWLYVVMPMHLPGGE
ncbi:MAG: DNA polymerase III subunit beta [Candidatus Fervidibacter sp.]|uniref:DNA polymerase III subunit beta n=1 Tax=Candidatus Fervidibacter sp. TaxID=3100871 RepID=UPI00404BA172